MSAEARSVGGYTSMARGRNQAQEGPLGPELHAYCSESWFTEAGARLKLRRLERAGLPDFSNWRFVTVTVASPRLSPEEAYRVGKNRMRRFLARFRKATGRPFLWCWKLEFHHDDDGYPHWHVLLEYKERIPEEILGRMEQWWGLGRINVRRVKRNDIRYVFKYVAKGPEELPYWVCRHRGLVRVFQACQGFYRCRASRAVEKKEPKTCLVKMTIGQRLRWDQRKALLIESDRNGLRRVRVVKMRKNFGALLQERAFEAISKGFQPAAPGVVNISWLESRKLQNENRRFAGLAGIPANASAT